MVAGTGFGAVSELMSFGLVVAVLWRWVLPPVCRLVRELRHDGALAVLDLATRLVTEQLRAPDAVRASADDALRRLERPSGTPG